MTNKIYEESAYKAPALPGSFLKRRLHSLTGLFLVLFLFEHLLTNSQAALFFEDNGNSFVQSVNFIQSLPYLPVIELTLLGFPIFLHGWFGIQYLFSAAPNGAATNGSKPSLDLPRNRAYNWMRITSLVLVVGIFLHVLTMRFLHYPERVARNNVEQYVVEVKNDAGLAVLAPRLQVTLGEMQEGFVKASAPSFGTATLLTVRDAFQSKMTCFFYTLFVLAACFHAMNGVWTFAISWGITLTERSRVIARRFSNVIMMLILLLGLMAIWGTYWISLST